MTKIKSAAHITTRVEDPSRKGVVQAVEMSVHGTDCGLSYKEKVGVLCFEVFPSQRRARVFFDGHAEGLSIDTRELGVMGRLKDEIRVQARIKTGGDLELLHEDSARAWLTTLRQRCLESYRALVPVRSAGQHSSPLAGKVKIKLANGRETTKTVPASQVEEIEGRLFIPFWLAKEKASPGSLHGDRRLPIAVEAALSKLQNDLELHISRLKDAALPLQEAERLEAPRRAQRVAEEWAEISALAKQRAMEEARAKEKFEEVAKKRALMATAKICALPIYAENATVKGRDWIKKAGQFSAEEWLIERATVRVSGTRAYIFTNGSTKPGFFKPLHTIEIIPTVRNIASP